MIAHPPTRLPGLLRRIVATAALVGAALSLLAGPAAATGPAPDMAVARFETGFMTTTIDHHLSGVRLGELCQRKAVTPRLSTLCGEIAMSQQAQIVKLQGWLADWYGVDKMPMLMPADQRMLDRLATLDGTRFDLAVLGHFTEHHAMFVEEGTECVDTVHHPTLRGLCGRMVAAQAREIGQFAQIKDRITR